MSRPGPTLWIEVDDLVHYLARHRRPSGIQRVTFELCRALQGLDNGAGRVRFVRRGDGPREVTLLDWQHLQTMFRQVAAATDTVSPVAAVAAPVAGSARQIFAAGLIAQANVVRELAGMGVRLGAHALANVQRGSRPGAAAAPDGLSALPLGAPLQAVAAPGDCFVVLSSPWARRDYAQTVRWVRDELRMRFALLIYDLIPLRRPEWCDRGVISSFAEWHGSVLPLADQIFAISRATADDIAAWAEATGLSLANPVQPIPMGTGLDHDPVSADPSQPNDPSLPPAGSYVLFVSTLEARKNHALLFRIWRRLLTDLPRTQVPTLVFAGRVGWLVADLLQQLENTAWLDGKIRLLRDPTDAELSALYRGCQFTLFPSLHEGWGLPVSESLALGRPCLASNRTSLPEAGGDLARYFDPENFADAYAAVRAVIADPAGLAAWQAQVAREFRHVPWERGAAVIRDVLAAAA